MCKYGQLLLSKPIGRIDFCEAGVCFSTFVLPSHHAVLIFCPSVLLRPIAINKYYLLS